MEIQSRIPAREICGVILAGGKSLRMGQNKALLQIDGESLIERVLRELGSVTNEIVISANDPSPFLSLGLRVISDLFPDRGPLAGLHAAMTHTCRPILLLLACDLPSVRSEFLSRMLELSEDFDAVIPRTADGMVHPLCAVYRRTCLPFIEAALIQGLNKMTAFFEDSSLKVRWLSLRDSGLSEEGLINLNSPKDLEDYLVSVTKQWNR